MKLTPIQPLGTAARGDIWVVNLEPVTGHEQGGERPAVVVSADEFNKSRAGLVIVAPFTTVYKGVPWHVVVNPSDGNVRKTSYIKCEDMRSISTNRLIKRWGVVSMSILDEVADRMRILLQM